MAVVTGVRRAYSSLISSIDRVLDLLLGAPKRRNSKYALEHLEAITMAGFGLWFHDFLPGGGSLNLWWDDDVFDGSEFHLSIEAPVSAGGTLTVQWGDGNWSEQFTFDPNAGAGAYATFNFNHTYNDDGSFSVSVDFHEDTGSLTDGLYFNISVANL